MKVSLLIRRTHMYLALFFLPWIVIYSLSTLFFNHGIRTFSAGAPSSFETESERAYSRSFPEDAEPSTMARQILQDLKLSGTHNARLRPDGSLIIQRRDAMTPRRITYDPESGILLVERQSLSVPTWLRTIHHRAGYRSTEVLEDAWGLSVDLAILAMIFWVLSGIWMWWEIPATRKWGLLGGMAGMSLFLFLTLIL